MAVATFCLMAIIAMLSVSGCSKNNGSGKTVKIESFTVAEDELILYADAVRPTPVGITLTPEDADPDNLEWTLPEDGQIALETVDGQIGLRGVKAGEYDVTISAEGIEKTHTLKVTVLERKFTISAQTDGTSPFDAGQTIYTTKLMGGSTGEHVSLCFKTGNEDADTIENVSATATDNSLILECKTQKTFDGSILIILMLKPEGKSEGFTVNYIEDGAAYSQSFTLTVPEDLTSRIDPDFAEILKLSFAVKDKDHITDEELSGVKVLRAQRFDGTQELFKRTSSFRGIEYLVNLETLEFNSFSMDSMKELDLSKNTKLSRIEIPQMVNLESLKIPSSTTYLRTQSLALKDIDFSGCTVLETIDIFCTNWENVDLSRCGKLKACRLSLEKGGEPAKLDLSGCDSLEVLSFISLKSGSRAMELNMPQKADNLTNITIMNVHLSGITPGEYPSLSYLGVTSCQLTGLDIRKCPERMTLGCKGNPGKDGKFIVRALFDNNSIPEGFNVNPDSWTMEDGSEVKVEFVK